MVIELQGHSYQHLYIGSKIDPAKIILEEGTVASGEEDVFYAEEQNIILEDNSGVAVTERFIADDRLRLNIKYNRYVSIWCKNISQ